MSPEIVMSMMDAGTGCILALLVFTAIALVYFGLRASRIEELRSLARSRLDSVEGWREASRGVFANDAGAGGGSALPVPVRRNGEAASAEASLDRAEPWAYGGMTVAAFAWSLATIDPDVIAAADFASTESITNGLEYAQYIHEHLRGLDEAAREGFLARLQGYVGERHVADILMAQGHTVEVAADPNQPVWDLLVDGDPVNVKTVADTASVVPEAGDHPDVTYIVPEDAHGPVADNVVHLEGFSHDMAADAVHESVAAAQGETALQWLSHHIPWVTLGFAAVREFRAVERGKPLHVALQHGLTDTVLRGGGAILGGKAGALVGSVLGPPGTLVGAFVGASLGSMFGGKQALHCKQARLRRAVQGLEEALSTLGRAFADRLDDLSRHLRAPLSRMQDSLAVLQRHLERRKASWRWWLWPDFQTVLLDEAVRVGSETVQRERAAVERVEAAFRNARRSGRYDAIGVMLANSPALRKLLDCTDEMLEPVHRARAAVLTEWRYLTA